MDDFERVICVKNEVFVYKIPPRQSARGYRAADWKLDQPDWTGRMRIVEKTTSKDCTIKLEDRLSGELFASALVDVYPGPVVEAVTDSSRYFVIKIQDGSGRHAFIGIGFTDRGDSFDMSVALQDHFKKEQVDEEIKKEDKIPQKPLDLGFKAGQTIKINLGNNSDGQSAKPKPKPTTGGIGLLPPPPGGGAAPMLAPPPCGGVQVNRNPVSPSPQAPQALQPSQGQVDWGDFSSSTSSASNSSSDDWVSFN